MLKNFFKSSIGAAILYPVNCGFDLLDLPRDMDTLQLTTMYANMDNKRLTDIEYVRPKCCYEQAIPLSISKEGREEYMLADMNRYFREYLGITANIEKRITPVYALVRTLKLNKVGLGKKETATNFFPPVDTIMNSVSFKRFRCWYFNAVLQEFVLANKNSINFFAENKKQNKTYSIVNETGWSRDKKVDMLLPIEGLRTIADLRKALMPYDINIMEVERDLNYLVFKKTKLF